MYRFNGSTEKANTTPNPAIESVGNLGYTYIGSEHIVLGLLKEGTGVAVTALNKLQVTVAQLEQLMPEKTGTGIETSLSAGDFMSRSKWVLQIVVMKAARLSHNYMGIEHLLIAILSEGDNYGVRFLQSLGAKSGDILNEISSVLSSGEDSAPAPGMSSVSSDRGGKGAIKTLDQLGRDLAALATKGGIDSVIGRQTETRRVIQILSRRTKDNPCPIGESGVGKAAVAEGPALKIAKDQVPELLKNGRVITLDFTGMVAGTKYRDDFEERIKAAMDEVRSAGNIALFIDELHTIIGAGSVEGSTDAANILKPALACGDFQVIDVITINEYHKYIEKDAALERRFQPVMVGESSGEEAIKVLKGLRDRYEAHHKVKITDEAIDVAVKLSPRYIVDRFLSDKAIDLMDEASSRVRLCAFTAPTNLQELERSIKGLEQEKAAAINTQEFERAVKVHDEEKKAEEELERQKNLWTEKRSHEGGEVTPEDTANVVPVWTGIPVVQPTKEESECLLHLEEALHQCLAGQEEAASAVSRIIRRGHVGLKDPKRPVGSFIFLGPTGVGKAELTKTLAEMMLGDENAMIRLDMSEYMEKHTVSHLVGLPPGYVGYDEGGQLTETVRRKPYSVVLFDEIEKVHPDVFNILLRILKDGRLTDAQSRKVDFKNTVIVMTSNIGARLITERKGSPGSASEENQKLDSEKVRELVLGKLKSTFRPEFLNRTDDIIVFHEPTDKDTREIAGCMFKTLQKRLSEIGVSAEFAEAAMAEIAKEGFDPIYGARPPRRVIQTRLEDRLSELMLEEKVHAGNRVVCGFENGEFTFVESPLEK